MITKEKLFQMAKAVRENAYAKYSNFKVGACIVSEDDHIFTGCNVENASHPCGQCAEMSAIGAMIASCGKTQIKTVCVVGDLDEGLMPCGNCLQRISEFSTGKTVILAADLNGIQKEYTLKDLLPNGFSGNHLKK